MDRVVDHEKPDRKSPGPSNPDFEKAVRESFARQGLMRRIGAWLTEVAPGRVVIDLPFTPSLSQQTGLFHGAVIAAVGDSAGGYAAMSMMPAGHEVVTVEYKINFLRPAKGQMLRADGRVVRQGRSLSVVNVDITCRDGETVNSCALLQATMMQIDSPAQ